MKKISLILIIILTTISLEAKSSSTDLAKRQVKLGITYYQGGDYAKSAEYLNKALTKLKGNDFTSKYWTAAAYEFLGYGALKTDDSDKAMDYMKKAQSIYDAIIKQPDGSDYALRKVMQGGMESLESNDASGSAFTFDGKKLRDFPGGVPKSVRTLSLADNKFTKFPDEVDNLTSLEYLDLSGNKIKDISSGISRLSKLHYLNLSGNKIKNLPAEIGDLKNLKELDLSNNRLKSLPPSLCNLKNLRILNLKGNKIPYADALNLARCLPNTAIQTDEYELKKAEEEEEPVAGE